jgi:putative transposase
MPNKKEISKICQKQSLSDMDTKYVLQVHSATGPSRKPSGHFNSVHDVIASRKMKWTVDSEARSTELPFALYCEFSQDILAIYAQPYPVKVSYKNATGKKITVMVTFDFLVVSTTKVFLVECKKNKNLQQLIIDKPYLYTYADGKYHYGNTNEVTLSTDIPVIVSTDKDYPPSFTRNCIYLFNFIDDYLKSPIDLGAKIAASIQRTGNRTKLDDLIAAYSQAAVIHALLNGDIFVEFDKDLLCNAAQTWVYYDKTYLSGLQHIKREYELITLSSLSDLRDQQSIWWDNSNWEIIDFTSTSLTIRKAERIVKLEKKELDLLIANQELYINLAPLNRQSESIATLSSHSPKSVETAINRLSIVRSDNPADERKASPRSIRRWKAAARDAEKNSQDPIIALLPKSSCKGNDKSRLQPELVSTIQQTIKDELLKPSPSTRYSAFGILEKNCAIKNIECCSLKTFYKYVERIPEHKRIARQKGFKAAYALGPQPYEMDLDWDLPYHGDFFFEIAHVDHTPLEICLVSALTGELIKTSLTLSLLIDGHTRTILAIYVSFEKPSYRSSMMLLRECYRRYQRLPLFIATDKGSDFQSHYFSRLLANLGIHHRNRPTAQPRHGSIVERVFGVAETELIHKLEGNKQLQKLGRGLSPSHNPEKAATLTPDEFYDEFSDYAYLAYPEINRRSVSERPKERMQRSLAQFDEHPGIKVESEQAFFISTLPSPKEKEGFRTINKNQIEFRHITYRLSERIDGYDGRKAQVQVKYDPYDPRFILACFGSKWVRLFTSDHLIRECYDKGIRFPHLEVIPRKTRDGQRYRNDPRVAAGKFANSLAQENHLIREKQMPPVSDNEFDETPSRDTFKFVFSNTKTLTTTSIK